MRKVLLDGCKGFYKANLHCHSTNSDGIMTPEELKQRYKSEGYSVLAITDHEHLIDNSHLNDENFLTITSCELAIKENDAVSALVHQDMKVCHLNVYARDAKNIKTPCYSSNYDRFLNDQIKNTVYLPKEDYKREYSQAGISQIIKKANEAGFLVSYNHPRWSLENATNYLGYKGLWAVEIYNNEVAQGGLYEYDINVYDDFLRAGQKIACISTDDNHKLETTCGGFVMINADKLVYPSIISALENHSFYASTGPEIVNLYTEGGKAFLTYKNGAYAVMSTGGRRVCKVMAENENSENIAEFAFDPERDGYIRFDVVDRFGKRANTNAYFL